MSRTEKAVWLLIREGYDDELATQLPKLFIEDCFDKDKENLSEAIDVFIDRVQSGQIIPDADNNVAFGGIIGMDDEDMNPKSFSGLFYNFRSHIAEAFYNIVDRKPLKNILLDGGAMELFKWCGQTVSGFKKEIFGKPQNYEDLCEVRPYGSCKEEKSYIRKNDLYDLLLSKGLSPESISIVMGKYGMGPRYPRFILNEGIYLNYDAVMKIGNPKYRQMIL